MHLFVTVNLCAWLCLSTTRTSAQIPADTLTSSGNERFNVDLVTGPLVAPNRVVGLAGAYTALGYGVDNAVITPAAYAVRTLWDRRFYDYDWTLDASPRLLRSINFINSGSSSQVNPQFLSLSYGAGLVVGGLGFGGIVRNQDYVIRSRGRLSMTLVNYGVSYAFLQGQLVVGLGMRLVSATLESLRNDTLVGKFLNTGPELGVILALDDTQLRVGAVVRTPVTAKSANIADTDGLSPPAAVVLPAEIQLGAAYQFGNRPLNRRWVDPYKRERELRNEIWARRLQRQRAQVLKEQQQHNQTAALPFWLAQPKDPDFCRQEALRNAAEEEELKHAAERAETEEKAWLATLSRNYLLLSADVLFIGQTANGISLDSFVSQRRQNAGRTPSLVFRVGAEAEPVPNRLRMRLGSYIEPSRYASVAPRLHGTIGSDVKLFDWDLFGLLSKFDLRLTLSLDVADRYRSVGISMGLWH